MTTMLRLLVDPPLDGATNMARDEALLDCVCHADAPPSLRFYRWSRPTISLGYFQAYGEYVAADPETRFAVVRRTTGGGAILHDRELTYALVVPSVHTLLGEGPTSLYCRMHDAIVSVVNEVGIPARRRGQEVSQARKEKKPAPFFCFAREHPLDVVVGREKLAGSAQRRTARGVLQHGSIILSAMHPEQTEASVTRGEAIDTGVMARRIADVFAERHGLCISEDGWHATELDRAKAHALRYNSSEWTQGHSRRRGPDASVERGGVPS